jgi:hypothetical protein
MNKSHKQKAEETLKYLCLGSRIEGIKFNGTQILISESETNSSRIEGQIYLNIESRFEIFESFPEKIPFHEDELPKLDWIEEAKRLCVLRLKRITDVRLGENIPHLFIQFESGEVLFVYGHHDLYENWQLGVWSKLNTSEHWDVIAIPGDDVAIWCPEI